MAEQPFRVNDATASDELRVGNSKLFLNNTAVTATATELNQLSGITLGTAASANTGDFATAAQGALADTALQTVAVDGVTITGDGTVGNPLVASGGGGGGVSIGDAVGGGTSGSILFVDASTNLAQDNSELFWDNTNNRLGIGTTSPSAAIEVDAGAASEYAILSTGANGRVGLTTQYGGIHFNNVEATSDLWQVSERDTAQFDIAFGTPDAGNNVGAGNTILRITSGGNVGVGLGSTNPSTRLHVNGTIRQTNSTNAVLVSDGNGDIGSASNLQDVAYLQTVATDGTTITGDGAGTPLSTTGLTETCMVRLDTSIVNFAPTGAYTLIQSNIPNPAIWDASPPNPNFDANTGLYTVATAGVYRISWAVAFRFTVSGQTQASRIYVNGNPAAQGTVSTTGNWPVPGGSILLTLNPGDTVGLYGYISQAGTNLVGDTTSVGAVYMSINKVSV